VSRFQTKLAAVVSEAVRVIPPDPAQNPFFPLEVEMVMPWEKAITENMTKNAKK
jgi:hypothetical protein